MLLAGFQGICYWCGKQGLPCFMIVSLHISNYFSLLYLYVDSATWIFKSVIHIYINIRSALNLTHHSHFCWCAFYITSPSISLYFKYLFWHEDHPNFVLLTVLVSGLSLHLLAIPESILYHFKLASFKFYMVLPLSKREFS